MSIKQQAISGVSWLGGAKLLQQILQFVITIILVRLLTPEDFGLIAMIAVFAGFAGLFSDLGFGTALIQKKEIQERHLSTIFWLNLIVGFALTCILLGTAPLVAKFYNEPKLTLLTIFVSINFFINSLKTVHVAILYRSMDFRKLAILETVGIVSGGLFAIIMAMSGFGVWSLAWQLIFTTSVSVLILWCVAGWRPKYRFDLNAAKELAAFSINLLGFNIFNYWARNCDDLLIGKLIGSSGL